MTNHLLRAVMIFGVLLGSAPAKASGDWQTVLHARDINKDGVIDAYYDSRLNITWLADANPAAGSAYDDGRPGDVNSSKTDGILELTSALAWIKQLDVYGVTGWRLPDSGYRLLKSAPREHELEILYFETLGNEHHRDTSTPPNTGPFSNVALGTDVRYFAEANTNIGYSYYFYWDNGLFGANYGDSAHAWAVHDGDISAVPEVGTAPMIFSGLALISAALLRRRRS